MKKLTYFFRTLAAGLLAANLLLSSGCFLFAVAAVGAGAAGTVAYVDGKLEASLGYSFESVAAASNRAISQLQFAQPEERKDALSDTLTTHDAKGDSIEVIVTKVGDSLTKVDIRVGTFGDQQMSQSILDKIKANL